MRDTTEETFATALEELLCVLDPKVFLDDDTHLGRAVLTHNAFRGCVPQG